MEKLRIEVIGSLLAKAWILIYNENPKEMDGNLYDLRVAINNAYNILMKIKKCEEEKK